MPPPKKNQSYSSFQIVLGHIKCYNQTGFYLTSGVKQFEKQCDSTIRSNHSCQVPWLIRQSHCHQTWQSQSNPHGKKKKPILQVFSGKERITAIAFEGFVCFIWICDRVTSVAQSGFKFIVILPRPSGIEIIGTSHQPS